MELLEQVDGFASDLANQHVFLVELTAKLERVLREGGRRDANGLLAGPQQSDRKTGGHKDV
eukprot:SAG25_NODE_9298_length_378_cov_1.096774_1_plen_60_part_10